MAFSGVSYVEVALSGLSKNAVVQTGSGVGPGNITWPYRVRDGVPQWNHIAWQPFFVPLFNDDGYSEQSLSGLSLNAVIRTPQAVGTSGHITINGVGSLAFLPVQNAVGSFEVDGIASLAFGGLVSGGFVFVTQDAVESLGTPTSPNALVTQDAAETLLTADPTRAGRVTQVAVEALIKLSAPPGQPINFIIT